MELKKQLSIKINEVDDNLLTDLLDRAKYEILDYTKRDVLNQRMESLQLELAVIYYNRMGSEGEASRSEGGISVNYNNDIPENILRRLKSFRRLRAVGLANENKE